MAEAKEKKIALIELSSKMEAELVEEVDRLTSRVEVMECHNEGEVGQRDNKES